MAVSTIKAAKALIYSRFFVKESKRDGREAGRKKKPPDSELSRPRHYIPGSVGEKSACTT